MKLLSAFGAVLRWWQLTVHLAVAAVLVAVVSHNATTANPVRPADGSPNGSAMHTSP